MSKLSKKISAPLITIFSIGVFCLLPIITQATGNLVVEFEQTPLFNEANFLPGQGVTRWVKVTNNSGSTQRIATETINENDPDNFASQLNLVIKEGLTTLYDNTLSKFFNAGETYLSDLANGVTTQYDFTITFNSTSGNPYQGKTVGFDILVGFQGTEGGLEPGEGGGGGGSLPPGLIILDESVKITAIEETSVIIIWTTNYFSTSQVVYATEGESHTLDLSDNIGTPPKYGYAHTSPEYDISPNVTLHSVTLTGLTPDTKYYYRAISHASLAISTEYSFTTSMTGEKEVVLPFPLIQPTSPTEPTAPVSPESETGEVVSPGVPPEQGTAWGGLISELGELTSGLGELLSRALASIGMAWGEITNSTFLTSLVIFLLLILSLISIREWWLARKKRKKQQ